MSPLIAVTAHSRAITAQEDIMSSKGRHLTSIFGTLALGAALILISSVKARAGDAIDDPARQPHLKSWSNVIPNATKRFVVLADFNNQAVLDRETGLVWEQSPEPQRRSSLDARFSCAHKKVGNRKGWRLPSLPELSSLVDPSVSPPGPTLPADHPFSNLQMDGYWSATSNADDLTIAWDVDFSNGNVNTNSKTLPSGFYAWCARGPMQADAY